MIVLTIRKCKDGTDNLWVAKIKQKSSDNEELFEGDSVIREDDEKQEIMITNFPIYFKDDCYVAYTFKDFLKVDFEEFYNALDNF